MKTKEFIRRVEELGYSIFHPEEGLMRVEKNKLTSCEYYATVSIYEAYKLDLNFIDFINMSNSEKEPLFNLIVQYARTPLDEREEEKKYRIKMLNNVMSFNLSGGYLNQETKNEIYMFSTLYDIEHYKTVFTQKEIDNFPDDVKEVLPLCKQIEVTP